MPQSAQPAPLASDGCSASTSSSVSSPPYSPTGAANQQQQNGHHGDGTTDIDELALMELVTEPRERVSMENFALIRVLGRGAYGKVFLVRKVGGHDSGKYYAMKVLKKTRVSQKQKTLEHTLAERKVLEKLKGLPFLVNMAYAFQTETKLHIVMEFVRGGELFTHLCKRKKFDVATTRTILAEIVVALESIHGAGVIYRDLKLENILLDAEGHVKLTDFGLSKAFEQGPNSTNSYCGTIEYMPPEIVRRQPEGYTHTVDWWSFGVIAFELLTGCSPFTVDGDQNSTTDIARRILTKRVPFPKWLDPHSRDMIGQLLTKEPAQRLGARGAAEVKRAKFFDGIDWVAVARRAVPGPVRPSCAGAIADVENFAAEFTAQTPLFSPAEPPPDECHTFFRGYSFVSPSVIFSNDNVIGQECLAQSVHYLASAQPKSTFFQRYRLDISAGGLLGRGAYSVCRKCERVSDGRQFAVKIVSQRFAHQARREVRVLEALQAHSHIVPLVEALSDTFHHYIVLELLQGGELLRRLRRMETFTELQAAEIMAQLVSAVKHMHDRDIVHRDLKPENILFESDHSLRLRLVDFGFARILPRVGSASAAQAGKSLITPLCGTLQYAAPEVLDIEDPVPQYNEQCDLWSLGVILFTMLSGKVPFHARSQAESAADIIARIRAANFSFEDPVWTVVSQPAKDLITGLLTVDPTRRLSLAQLNAHPWLRTGRTATPEGPCGFCPAELPTPTILPSSADETFNATISAFICAHREGFQLMDVQTAPLLVKRRGMKRQRGQDVAAASTTTGQHQSSGSGTSDEGAPPAIDEGSGKLSTVPEGSELEASLFSPELGGAPAKRRPTSLLAAADALLDAGDGSGCPAETTPQFTEYRDTKPPYLKYSRDDIARAECAKEAPAEKASSSEESASEGSVDALRSSNESN